MPRRLTTYEAMLALRDAYAKRETPALRLYAFDPLLWWLAYSFARYAPSTQAVVAPIVPFRYESAQDFVQVLSTWRHVSVDADELERFIAAHVHGGDALSLAALRALWKPALALVNSMRTLPTLSVMPEAPPLACLSADALALALEAPDVRKVALQLWYRRARRAHEMVPRGEGCDSLVQRERPAHIVQKYRWRLLHAPSDELTESDWSNIRLACVHCALHGQQGFDFKSRAFFAEAELMPPVFSCGAHPVVLHRRSGWAV